MDETRDVCRSWRCPSERLSLHRNVLQLRPASANLKRRLTRSIRTTTQKPVSYLTTKIRSPLVLGYRRYDCYITPLRIFWETRFYVAQRHRCFRRRTRLPPLSAEDANRLIEKFVRHYNQVRLHSAIGDIAPQDKLVRREQEIFDERDRKLEAARLHHAQRRQAWRGTLQEVRSQTPCYNKDAWAEDRGLLGSNPSADSGPEAKHEAASPPPHFLPNDSLLARSDKSQGVWGKIPQGTENQRCLPFDTTPPAGLNSRIENSGSR